MSIIHKSAGVVLCVFVLSAPAYADIYNNNGAQTQSLYISKSKKVEQQISAPKIQKAVPTPSAKEKEIESETAAMESAADQVWEKYKALAAGLGVDTDEGMRTIENKSSEQPKLSSNEKEAPVQKTGDTTQPQNPIGLTNLLRSYQKNRAQRAEIRSLQTNYKADRLRSIENQSQE